MSWVVSSSGRTKAVAVEIDKQLAAIAANKYVTDEAELRQVTAVRELMAKTLADFSDNTGVKAEASGSLSSYGEVKNYSVSFKVEPLWNWVQ